jgi:hypothetical protein
MATTPRWGGLRLEPYDPNSRDADGDGIVQEGTAFERPAGTQIWDGLNQLAEGLVSPDRDTGWLVYNPEEFSFVEYTPSYGGAFETPLAKSLDDTVGTVGSRMGTIGDQQGTIGDRGTLESIVGTISRPPTPRPIERRESITPEVAPEPQAPTPVTAGAVGDSRLPEGFIPGMILPEQEELFKRTVDGARFNMSREGTLGVMIQGRSAELEKTLKDFPEVYDRIEEIVARETINGLRKELDDSLDKPITIAMPEGVLGRVIADGRYKTQFESSVSGGLLNPDFRSEFELMHMGVPRTIDPKLRPVYGFRETGKEEGSVASMYGNTTVVLKTDIADRTTITIGDSLSGTFPVPHGQSASDDRLLASANLQQVLGHTGNGLLAALQELRDDETLDDGWKPLIDKALAGFEPDLYIKPHYVESQIFGGVRAEDIDHVRLPWDVKPELVEDLRARGISFYVQKRDESDITFEERFNDDVRTSQFDTPEITPTPVPRQRAQQVPEFASSAGDTLSQDKPSDIPGATPSSQAEAPAAPDDGVPEWLTPEELARLEPGFIPGKPTQKMTETIDRRAARGREDIAVNGRAEIAYVLGPQWDYEKVKDDPVLQELVNRHETLVIDQLRDEIERAKDAEIVVAVPETLIRQIVADGRYKSQFETNKSGGMLNNGVRSSFEEANLGVSPTIDPTARPLYAFVDTLEGFGSDRLSEQYGDGRIHLKPSTKQRATLTLGDSLDTDGVPVSFFDDIDDGRVLAASGEISSSQKTPSALYEAATSMLEDGSLGDDADIYEPLLRKIVENLDPDFNDTMTDETAYYTEAQIHGQIRVEDIELVTLPDFYETLLEDEDEEWLRETIEGFERNGIPYRFGYDGDIVTPERPAAAAVQEPVPVSSERTYDPFDTSAPDYDPTRDPFSDSFISSFDSPPEVATPAPRASRPTPESRRDEGFTKISVNPDEVESMRESLETTLLNRYLSPEERNLPAVDKVRLLSERMGIRFEQPTDEMIDSAISQFEAGQRIDKSLDVIRAVPLDSPKYARTRKLIEQMEEVQEMVKTEEGRAAIRERMAEGLISSLSAQEDIYNRYPIMRANNVFGIMPNSETSHLHAAGVASTGVVNGMITLRYRIGAHSLIMGSLEVDGIEDGDIFSDTLRVAGTRSYQIALASHELGHHAHMIASLRRKGLEPSSTKSFIEQLKEQGPLLEDSLAGVKLAALRNLPLSTRLDDLDEDQRKTLGDYAVGGWKEMPREKRLERDSDAWEESVMFQTVYGGKDRVIGRAIAGTGFDDSWSNVPEELATPESLAAFVEQRLGMPAAEFARQLHESIIDDIGVDPRRIASNGLTVAEMEEVFKSISDYGASTWTEGVAETFSLQFLRDKLSDVRIDQNIMTQYDSVMANILEGIEGDMREVRISNKTKELLRLIDDLNNDPLVRGLEEDLL